MKELKLPIINESHPKPRTLSMDEYFEFVLFNLRHTVNIEEARKRKKMAVDVPFKIK